MVEVTRRGRLGVAAGGLAAASVLTTARAQGFGNPDLPPQGAVNAQNPASLTDPGPQYPAIASQFPAAVSPPATSTNNLQMFWASFNNAAKRIQNGGWARQGDPYDFEMSETIAGVNMRLTEGRHTRTALARICRMGVCNLRYLSHHRPRPGGASLCGRCQRGRAVDFPARLSAFAAGHRRKRHRIYPRFQ